VQRQLTSAIDAALVVATCAVIVAWVVGHPILYTPVAPVMSPFTAFSLLVMVSVRQARIHLETWPMTQSLALTGLVLGGNVSSILLLAIMPPGLQTSFSGIVLTSAMTSVGLVLFCLYDLVIALRDTPESAFIMDDMLIGGDDVLPAAAGPPAAASAGRREPLTAVSHGASAPCGTCLRALALRRLAVP